MAAIEHMTISLPAGMVARLRDRIRAGEYKDESAAVEDALSAADAEHILAALLPLAAGAGTATMQEQVLAALEEHDEDPDDGFSIEQVLQHLQEDATAAPEHR